MHLTSATETAPKAIGIASPFSSVRRLTRRPRFQPELTVFAIEPAAPPEYRTKQGPAYLGKRLLAKPPDAVI